MTDTTTTSSSAAWLAAAQSWFTAHDLPVQAADGRLLVALPITGRSEKLRVSLVAADSTNGLVARAHVDRPVARDHFPRVLWLCNRWNRAHASPRATLFVKDWEQDPEGSLVLDAWLPAGRAPDDAQVDLFLSTFLKGAPLFLTDPGLTALST